MDKAVAQLQSIRKYTSETSVKIYCFEELDLNLFEDALNEVSHLKVKKVIFIYEKNCVSTKKLNFYRDIYDIDFFTLPELQILLRGHRLLPAFRKLDIHEQKSLVNLYGVDNLPRQSLNDPITKLYDFKQGDVIEITRKRGLYYRIVSDD